MNPIYHIGIQLVATGAARAAVEIKKVSQEVAHLEQNQNKARASLSSMAQRFASIQTLLNGTGTALAAIGQGAHALLSASAAAQRLHTQLNFASAAGSAKELQFIGQLTDRLGLNFDATAQAFAGFAAAARGTAIEGAAAREVFAAISEASAVMGLDAQQTSAALLAHRGTTACLAAFVPPSLAHTRLAHTRAAPA